MKLFKLSRGVLILILAANLLFSNCLSNENKNKNSIKSGAKENLKLNGGINLEETQQRHKRAKSNLEKALRTRLTSSSTVKDDKPESNIHFIQTEDKEINPTNQSIDAISNPSPILFEGWIKYFKYSTEDLNITTPKEFIKNPDFYNQKKFFPGQDFRKPDAKGKYNFIRDENYFSLSIFRNSYVFNSSKKVKFFNNYL